MAILLRLLRVDALKAVLGEILGNMILRKSGAIGKSGVVAVVELVRTSHFRKTRLVSIQILSSCMRDLDDDDTALTLELILGSKVMN